MSRPSVGELNATEQFTDKDEIPKELTVLKRDSRDTIYNLIFSEIKDEDSNKNGWLYHRHKDVNQNANYNTKQKQD